MRPIITDEDNEFMQMAIDVSAEHMRAREGGPFGAVIVRRGEVLGRGWNEVTSANDPTAHAEVNAIRAAAKALENFELSGCVLYSSCEPCPMCLAAAYWARIERIVYAATRVDAAAIGFDDAAIYDELAVPLSSRKLPIQQVLRDKAVVVFDEWRRMPDKTPY